jgi:hypothetical protein
MRRRDFITILGGASATLPFGAVAQEPGRIYRYGILAPFPCEGAPVIVALSDEIRRRGFINGQNLTNVAASMAQTSSWLRNMRASWSKPSTSSSLMGTLQFARRSRRRKQLRS